jgi:GMP synthase (glutamine-hydrolysing)
MILLINICKEKLHYYEFVKPIEDILVNEKIPFQTKEYRKLSKEDIKNADKIIISGTSLKDNDFAKINNLKLFDFLNDNDFNKPVLGICAGMHIIGRVFSRYLAKMIKETEIGFFKENFRKNFLGLEGEHEVYHLHNNYIDFMKSRDFEIFASSINFVTQAIKHKQRPIYGILFHPEVRQKQVIINFCKL